MIYLFGLLFITALMDASTIIMPSWSEIPWIIDVFFTSPGLFVQNRSRMALCFVGSRTNCVNSKVPSMVRSRWHIPLLQASGCTVVLSQSIPGALKSPATISPALGFLSSSACSSTRASSSLSSAATVSLLGL